MNEYHDVLPPEKILPHCTGDEWGRSELSAVSGGMSEGGMSEKEYSGANAHQRGLILGKIILFQ